jgi:hypothetical protein
LPRPGRWSWALPTPARPSAEGCQARPAGRLNAPRGRPLATFLAPGNQQATRSQTPLARKRRRSDPPRLRPIFGSRRPLERAGETPARAAAKETPLVAQTVAARRARSAYTSRLHPLSPLPIQATKRPSTRGCRSAYQIARKASPSLKRAMRCERPLSAQEDRISAPTREAHSDLPRNRVL